MSNGENTAADQVRQPLPLFRGQKRSDFLGLFPASAHSPLASALRDAKLQGSLNVGPESFGGDPKKVRSRRGRGAYFGNDRELRDGGGLVMALGPPGRGWCPRAAGRGGMAAVADPAGWPNCLPSLLSTASTPAELAAELSHGLERVAWPPDGTLALLSIRRASTSCTSASVNFT